MINALDPRTPVLVGVGQVGDPTHAPDFHAWPPVDLAAAAARAALSDARGQHTAAAINVIAGVRQFEVSIPGVPAPLGRADNYPRAVAGRLGIDPAHAILEVVGGQAPQSLVTELAGCIAAGRADGALVVGAEAISTVTQLLGKSDRPDFTETVPGQLADRGYGLRGIVTDYLLAHGVLEPITAYGLLENARRHRLGLSREDYRRHMAELLAPFSAVAATNPLAAVPTARSAVELGTVSERNRLVNDLYPLSLVAREKVNLGAAVLLLSVGRARECGIDPDRWVFLAGHAGLREQGLLDRPDLSRSPAAVRAVAHALDVAGIGLPEVATLDLYSCFPVAVAAVADAFALSADDPRGLTVTGGLPFFGGPGNNYSMHAIAQTVHRLRARPGAHGLVWANGGVLSKHAVGVYTTTPTPWRDDHSAAIQAELDAGPSIAVAERAEGPATLETLSVMRTPTGDRAAVVGRLADGRRFLANPDPDDDALSDLLAGEHAFGARLSVRAGARGNRITMGRR
jgi:acetyl-CoA C-acetyltransferase